MTRRLTPGVAGGTVASMTKSKTATVERPRSELQLAGVELLDALKARLRDHGYVKTAVDTYSDRASGHSVRHSYSGGEWTLACGYNGGARMEVRYSVHATMPDVEELLTAVLPKPF